MQLSALLVAGSPFGRQDRRIKRRQDIFIKFFRFLFVLIHFMHSLKIRDVILSCRRLSADPAPLDERDPAASFAVLLQRSDPVFVLLFNGEAAAEVVFFYRDKGLLNSTRFIG